ncbi:MAG TPA: carboxypeptidase-like regulatory domain-containing protein [Candidatus Limnocylindria bacterium]|nr:carboxypeptidase-like regulatory domain-containing protein [Candidatus Limnocylindria bacterium]
MRASIRRGSWLLIVILLAGLGTGCDRTLVRPGSTPRPTPTPGPTFDPELTGFDGIVVDESGEPIAGVHIVLRQSGRQGTAATTAEGTFFDRGHLGEIGISASLEGYETAETTVTVVPDEIAEVEIVLSEE